MPTNVKIKLGRAGTGRRRGRRASWGFGPDQLDGGPQLAQGSDAGLPGMMQAGFPCGWPSGSDLMKNLKAGPLTFCKFPPLNRIILF